MTGLKLIKSDALPEPVMFVQFEHIHKAGRWTHGISTRRGGISPYPFNTMNLGFTTDDFDGNLQENRRRFLQALNLDGLEIRQWIDLVHGNHIVVAEEIDPGELPVTADGIITAQKNKVLSTTFADCIPIILADPETGAFGVIHGGWRGTFSSIAGEGVAKMSQLLSVNPENLLAGIGPGINRCCFETGQEVADAFFYKFYRMQDLITESSNKGKWNIDLLGLNRQILIESGLKPERITVCNLCTRCREDLFFSYRRDGNPSGRMAAVMARTQ